MNDNDILSAYNHQLNIKGLTVMSHIGVYEWEKQILQKLLIDIELIINLHENNDQLSHTIDYATICNMITDHMKLNVYNLVETVANNIAMLIFNNFKLNKIKVTVHKPYAIKNAQDISVIVCIN